MFKTVYVEIPILDLRCLGEGINAYWNPVASAIKVYNDPANYTPQNDWPCTNPTCGIKNHIARRHVLFTAHVVDDSVVTEMLPPFLTGGL